MSYKTIKTLTTWQPFLFKGNFILYTSHISKFMSGKSKNAKTSDWKHLVNVLLMFKVGGVNSPHYFCYVPYNNKHNRSISQ